MKILVTGGTGFIGRAVCSRLASERQAGISRTVRSPAEAIPGVTDIRIDDIGPETEWAGWLRGVDAIVHAAARVHAVEERAQDPLAEYRRVNVGGTVNLARQAAAAGVRRFVFISTIKVNGARTCNGQAFSAEDSPAPADAYSRSKHEAETALRNIVRSGGMEVVIIRPPLVYGPGVQANFLALMRWIHRGTPIPLRCVRNRRSLVARQNLVDLVTTCLRHPAAANQTLTVCDGEDVSTRELAVRIGAAMQRPITLVPVPVWLLRGSAGLVGKRSEVDRLLSSLQVDMTRTRRLLAWEPVTSMETALQETVDHFRETMRR